MQPLTPEVIAVVREDMEYVKEEAGLILSEARQGAAALAAGGACGLLALWSGHTALLRRLEQIWPSHRVAGALALAYAGGASALSTYGLRKARQARAASRETVLASRDMVEHIADELKQG
ncbi:phage holin family protein [Streptomyces sp. SP18CS02]|uniref:phage holin family protein n=1 Tax=Streptomyces sp. SP18CS02 TaxID=3002531 RepID=UPI002E7A856B|nr:phage holin family protein [Streptomyces sp. SP18CS02]MEE1752837.1 hypothetical protein [Streptomyces sp. SP18CS02]